jgi:hypothetical protein
MKAGEFSHKDASIFVGKARLSRLAFEAKKNTGEKHTRCLAVISSILCGTGKNFAQYWEEGIFDYMLGQAIEQHPDIVIEKFKKIAKFAKIDFDTVKKLTGTASYESIHE